MAAVPVAFVLLRAASAALSDVFPEGVPGYGAARGVTVQSRLHPDYVAPGLRAGSFVLRPRLSESLGYDDNVLGSPRSPGSAILRSGASLLATSDWSRNRLGASLGIQDTRFLDTPKQSRTDWQAGAGGVVEIGRDRLTLAAAHLSLHQDRTEIDALPSDRPIPFRVENARAAYAVHLGRLTVTPSLDVAAYRFDSTSILGVPVSQSYRDRNVVQGGLTAQYALAGQRSLVFLLRGTGVGYTRPQPGQPTRDSTGFAALAGIDYDADGIWRYRLLGGVELRSFAASQYATHAAPVVEASVSWNPTSLTTVTGLVSRSIEDAAQEGVAGYTDSRVRLTIDHEYLRNVLLQARAGVQLAQFLQGGGTQTGWGIGASATWLIDRNVSLTARYDFTERRGGARNASLGSSGYARDIGLLTLNLAL